jgi:hypothetical protein
VTFETEVALLMTAIFGPSLYFVVSVLLLWRPALAYPRRTTAAPFLPTSARDAFTSGFVIYVGETISVAVSALLSLVGPTSQHGPSLLTSIPLFVAVTYGLGRHLTSDAFIARGRERERMARERDRLAHALASLDKQHQQEAKEAGVGCGTWLLIAGAIVLTGLLFGIGMRLAAKLF